MSLGFEESTVMPSVYVHRKREVELVIHVDDFMGVGAREDLEWLKDEIAKVYQNTSTILGPEDGQVRSGVCLGRRISWTTEGIEIEGNPIHVKEILKSLGMTNCQTASTPLLPNDFHGPPSPDKTVKSCEVPDSGEQALSGGDARLYRKCSALAVYAAQDRLDLSTAACHLSKFMSCPTLNSFDKLRRVARYLKTFPRCKISFPWQDDTDELTLITDADWAECRTTRKSHSGGAILLGKHLISHWTRIQPTIALSSGESELFSAVRLVSLLGHRQLGPGPPWPRMGKPKSPSGCCCLQGDSDEKGSGPGETFRGKRSVGPRGHQKAWHQSDEN